MKKYILFIVCALSIAACNEVVDYSLEGEFPSKPEFDIQEVPGDPNSFVVTDLSEGNFNRTWEFVGGIPETSTLASDTVFYSRAGEYDVNLHVSSSTGGGTSYNSKPIDVAEDVAGCQFLFLNEDCSTKCWRLSEDVGGIRVGPSPYSGEWFTSDGIVPTQADDRWCFSEDGTFEYENSGSSFSACAGFIEIEDYPIPEDMTWSYAEGAGQDGLNRITLPEIWMGIEDTGVTYDIVEVSETEMTLLTPIKPCDGAASPGWFTITFYIAE